jgi:hypothetical protein
MRRRLLNLLAVLSALLCVAVCVVWVRSYFVGEAVIWGGVRPAGPGAGVVRWSVNVWSAQGGVGVFWDELRDSGGGGGPGPGFTWARDRMRVYPYVPIPTLRQGRAVRGLGVTLFERHSAAGQVTDPTSGAAWGAGRERVMILPYWLPTLATGALPAWRAAARRRGRRRLGRLRRGLCPGCGYDLRATPGRCPECGAVPS